MQSSAVGTNWDDLFKEKQKWGRSKYWNLMNVVRRLSSCIRYVSGLYRVTEGKTSNFSYLIILVSSKVTQSGITNLLII